MSQTNIPHLCYNADFSQGMVEPMVQEDIEAMQGPQRNLFDNFRELLQINVKKKT